VHTKTNRQVRAAASVNRSAAPVKTAQSVGVGSNQTNVSLTTTISGATAPLLPSISPSPSQRGEPLIEEVAAVDSATHISASSAESDENDHIGGGVDYSVSVAGTEEGVHGHWDHSDSSIQHGHEIVEQHPIIEASQSEDDDDDPMQEVGHVQPRNVLADDAPTGVLSSQQIQHPSLTTIPHVPHVPSPLRTQPTLFGVPTRRRLEFGVGQTSTVAHDETKHQAGGEGQGEREGEGGGATNQTQHNPAITLQPHDPNHSGPSSPAIIIPGTPEHEGERSQDEGMDMDQAVGHATPDRDEALPAPTWENVTSGVAARTASTPPRRVELERIPSPSPSPEQYTSNQMEQKKLPQCHTQTTVPSTSTSSAMTSLASLSMTITPQGSLNNVGQQVNHAALSVKPEREEHELTHAATDEIPQMRNISTSRDHGPVGEHVSTAADVSPSKSAHLASSAHSTESSDPPCHRYDPSIPLRFHRVPLNASGSPMLHILETPPPRADYLVAKCVELAIPVENEVTPHFSKVEHWRQHQSTLTSGSTMSVAQYAHMAMGGSGEGVSSRASVVRPPKDCAEFMADALPTDLPSDVQLHGGKAPTFEIFHPNASSRSRDAELSADAGTNASTLHTAFIPAVPPPAVHHRVGYTHVFEYALPPPTLAQFGESSKHWKREIDSIQRKENQRRRRRLKRTREKKVENTEPGARHIDPALTSASDDDAEDESDRGSIEQQSDSDDAEENVTEGVDESEDGSVAAAVALDLPRPASPKHDESCHLSVSYFLPQTPAATYDQGSASKQRRHVSRGMKLTSKQRMTSARHHTPSASKQTQSGAQAESSDNQSIVQPPNTSIHPSIHAPSFTSQPSAIAASVSEFRTPSKVPRLTAHLNSPQLSALKSASSSASASLYSSGEHESYEDGMDSASKSRESASQPISRGSAIQRAAKQAASQVEGPATIGATPLQYKASPSSSLGTYHVDISEQQHLRIVSIEVHAWSRGQFLPDPKHDPIAAIVYCVRNQIHGEHEHQPDVMGILLCHHMPDISTAHTPTQTTNAGSTNAPNESTTGETSAAGATATSKTAPPLRSCPTCSPLCALPSLSFPDFHPTQPTLQYFATERSLLHGFISLIRRLDPDIMLGYEIQKGSLGYIVERSQYLQWNPPMLHQLSRVAHMQTEGDEGAFATNANKNGSKKPSAPLFTGAERDQRSDAANYAWSHSSGLLISGRIVLNLWRILKDEIRLTSYTFQSTAAKILGVRKQEYPAYVKTRWMEATIKMAGGGCGGEAAPDSDESTDGTRPIRNDAANMGSSVASSTGRRLQLPHTGSGLYRVLEHCLDRCRTNLEMIDRLDLIGRTAELARVFGMKFFSVLDRGSQYRVESLLLRLSKPQNLLLLSVSPETRSNQPVMECIPLVMEPVSGMYTSPVVVLDFQSLYPSMMIAYNICYSTCLGKIPTHATTSQIPDESDPAESKANTHAAANVPTTPTHTAEIDAQPSSHHRHTEGEIINNVAGLSHPSPLSQSQLSDASQPSQPDPRVNSPRSHRPPTLLPITLTSPRVATPPSTSQSLNDSPPSSLPLSSTSPPTQASLLDPDSFHLLGGSRLGRSSALLNQLNRSSQLFISSNGVMFVRPQVQQGVLPRMLREILETRVMVKRSMSRAEVQSHRGLHRLLNARQFGLKLISNVTYGYTAAGFSGRMPCAEIADSIVQSGRDTLERAIRIVESTKEWKAKVIYGDTDSLFVLLPGRSRHDAFKIGQEIAKKVTEVNPRPVVLQMEKVYQPCCLLSKKRYVGYRYDSPDQSVATFDAKGIETVRRDGVSAVGKMMESVLRTLFESGDLSAVRHYLERQWSKIWMGKVSLADFTFRKEVRLGRYRSPPLAAILAMRMKSQDPRSAPLHAERLPYIIVDGAPHARLVDRLQHPLTVLIRPDLYRLCASYYIEVVINRPLMRILDLLGVDLAAWYANWPRPRRQTLAAPIQGELGTNVVTMRNKHRNRRGMLHSNGTMIVSRGRVHGLPNPTSSLQLYDGSVGMGGLGSLNPRRTIDQYYISQHCPLCDKLTSRTFCDECMDRGTVAVSLNASSGAATMAHGAWVRLAWMSRVREAERAYQRALDVCRHCMGEGQRCGGIGGRVSVSACASLVCGSIHHGSSHSISLSHSPPHLLYPCISLDCPNQFTRQRKLNNMKQAQAIAAELSND